MEIVTVSLIHRNFIILYSITFYKRNCFLHNTIVENTVKSKKQYTQNIFFFAFLRI